VRRTIALILTALPAVLIGCGDSPDPALSALQADPMATVEIEGTTTDQVFETPAGTTLGKPVYATILRVLKVADPSNPEPVFQRALQEAEDSSWHLFEQSNRGAHGEKALPPDGKGEITISVFEHDGEMQMNITLTYKPT